MSVLVLSTWDSRWVSPTTGKKAPSRICLENELYIGNTINMRFSSKSYKDKRKIEHPREECIVIEGSHEAIIDRETWDIVQRVRQNRKRPTKMEELNKYSGLVICADCRIPQWFFIGRIP